MRPTCRRSSMDDDDTTDDSWPSRLVASSKATQSQPLIRKMSRNFALPILRPPNHLIILLCPFYVPDCSQSNRRLEMIDASLLVGLEWFGLNGSVVRVEEG